MTFPEIIARSGEKVFLVAIDPDLARVLDMEQQRYFPPSNMQSVLARGYWRPYSGPQAALDQMLRQIGAEGEDD